MIKILLSGCNGTMGRIITQIAEGLDTIEIIAGYDINSTSPKGYPVITRVEEYESLPEKPDVLLDFSNPAAFAAISELIYKYDLGAVVATTGLSSEQVKTLTELSSEVPIFYARNMSLGINVITDLVKRTFAIIGDKFDIEIVEKHHNQKVDAPSGTALSIADAINAQSGEKYKYMYDRTLNRQKRDRNEIGIHSLRCGTIVGEHSVVFAGNDEIIEIKHTAMSKNIFAEGALRAAQFIYLRQPGMYNMTDLVSAAE